MSEQKIDPSNVTKPIQLLAAWLVGLILIDGAFLSAAKVISTPTWAAGALVLASIANVPIFLSLIFFLQTKFRPELQEDTFYSKHLEKVTGTIREKPTKSDLLVRELNRIENQSNTKIDEIKNKLDEVTEELSQNKLSELNLEETIEKIQRTRESLEIFEVQKTRDSTKVSLNDLIPNYEKVARDLIKSGYKIYDTFGTSSDSMSSPKELTLTFLPGCPKESLREIYLIAKAYGFNRIDYDNQENAPEDSDIYIGSYIDSFNTRASVFIDEQIERMILDRAVPSEDVGRHISAIRE